MTRTLQLRFSDLRCDIAPDIGGCVSGLWHGSLPVLRPAAEGFTSARKAGSFVLVPYSNRIGHALLPWNGLALPLEPNFDPEPHAVHGTGWRRPWAVLDSGASSAVLALDHVADGDWPFDFSCVHELRLDGTTLTQTLRFTSHAAGPAPAGLGWHPYFFKRPSSHLSFGAAGRWEMDARNLPTVRTATRGIDADCAGLEVDHCFDGWSGEARLRDAHFDLRVRSDQRRLVACTGAARDFVAIEPVSHVNNAAQLAAGGADAATLGWTELQPGASMTAWMAIDVARMA